MLELLLIVLLLAAIFGGIGVSGLFWVLVVLLLIALVLRPGGWGSRL